MIPVLVGLGVLIGGAILVAGWKAVIDWLNDFIPKLKQAWKTIRPGAPYLAQMYGDAIVEGTAILGRVMHRFYYMEDDEWYEETTSRMLKESQVPERIRQKLHAAEEVDITDDMELELGYSV